MADLNFFFFLPSLVLGLTPGNVEAALAMAEMYAQQGQVDRAIDVLKNNLAGMMTIVQHLPTFSLLTLHYQRLWVLMDSLSATRASLLSSP